MNLWHEQLKADPLPWLLEPVNPSVRYWALRDLLNRPPQSPEMTAVRTAIPYSSLVQEILARQHPQGYWTRPGIGYFPAYQGTVWQIILLAELGMSSADERVRRMVDYFLAQSQFDNGDLAAFRLFRWKIRTPVPGPCFWGNMMRSLLRFGYDDDPRLRAGIRRLAERGLATSWKCRAAGREPCLWGLVKALSAFAEIPLSERPALVEEACHEGAEHLLSQLGDELFEKHPSWLRLGFPRFFQSDLLEALETLARLGYGADPRLQALLPHLLAKQGEDGRWRLEHDGNFRARGLVQVEEIGQASKWVTLGVLRVLKWAASD